MNLLILDLDETLLFATQTRLQRDPDVIVGPYHVYFRPYLAEFFASASRLYDLAVWTSADELYAREIVAALPFSPDLEFLWSRQRCTQAFDAEKQEHFYVKDLKKVARQGYDLNRVLVVDDSPEKLSRHYGNYIRVTEFRGDIKDDELRLLDAYLPLLADSSAIRSIEKRGWRSRVRD